MYARFGVAFIIFDTPVDNLVTAASLNAAENAVYRVHFFCANMQKHCLVRFHVLEL